MMIEKYMKDNGKTIKEMVMDMKFIKMETVIEDSLLIINLMEKEFIVGLMEKFMMESG